MEVSGWEMTKRGLLLRCPSCGEATLVRRLLAINEVCRGCGLVFEHDDGFYFGAWHFNYTVTALVALTPPLIAIALRDWSTAAAIEFATIVSIVFPVLFFWHAKSLWLATYYHFVPEDLDYRPPLTPAEMLDAERDPATLTVEQRERRFAQDAIAQLEGGRPTLRR